MIQNITYNQQRATLYKHEVNIRATFKDEEWEALCHYFKADFVTVERILREHLENFFKEMVFGPQKD